MRFHFLLSTALLGLTLAACGGTEAEADGEFDTIAPPGKADATWGECEVRQVLSLVNDPLTDLAALRALGVTTRAANNVLNHRTGPDGLFGTEDDDPFDTIQELDDIPYIGPKTMDKLVAACSERCRAPFSVQVIFSPQAYTESHLAEVTRRLGTAQRSIDVAMYSFSDSNILNALAAATARGVKVRFLFDGTSVDRKAPAGTMSAKLEDRGVDVRWVNKILHHKFVLIDGPSDSMDQAYTGTLITGSGNWSNSAGTRYDENTSFVQGNGEVLAQFQQEFNYLWHNSREFTWNPTLLFFETAEISDPMIVDDPYLDTAFTSANFRITTSSLGPTFSVVSGNNEVSDRLVEYIRAAEHSIWIASGHLRSRPVAEALLAKWAERPQLDIRVYLDQQEFIGESTNAIQERELADCLTAAGDSLSKQQTCYDVGYYFSYPVYAAGIPIRFKTYCYRWHYTYAVQMHHKYMIFDGQTVASGSYNLSDNAEHATIENMVFYRAERFPELVQAFRTNFEAIWETGVTAGLYEALLADLRSGINPVPLVFDSMALTWPQLDELKQAIRDACPAVNTDPYRLEPDKHTVCYK